MLECIILLQGINMEEKIERPESLLWISIMIKNITYSSSLDLLQETTKWCDITLIFMKTLFMLLV